VRVNYFLLWSHPAPVAVLDGVLERKVYSVVKRCRIIVLKKYANVCAGGLD
jgi:hypothetical protein